MELALTLHPFVAVFEAVWFGCAGLFVALAVALALGALPSGPGAHLDPRMAPQPVLALLAAALGVRTWARRIARGDEPLLLRQIMQALEARAAEDPDGEP